MEHVVERAILMGQAEMIRSTDLRQRARTKLTATGKIVVERSRRIPQDVANLKREIEEIGRLHTGH